MNYDKIIALGRYGFDVGGAGVHHIWTWLGPADNYQQLADYVN